MINEIGDVVDIMKEAREAMGRMCELKYQFYGTTAMCILRDARDPSRAIKEGSTAVKVSQVAPNVGTSTGVIDDRH